MKLIKPTNHVRNGTNGHNLGDILEVSKQRELPPLQNISLSPHSEEAEQGVLGCLLTDPAGLATCLSTFGQEEVFYDLRHQSIFSIMTEMSTKGEGLNLITVYQRLKDRGLIEQVGGRGYLSELADCIPSVANLSAYIAEVVDKFLLRKALRVCLDAQSRIGGYEGDADAMLDQLEREVLAVRALRHGRKESPATSELVKKALGTIEDIYARQGKISGLSTGLSDLDEATDGLHAGEMVVLAAFPSCGKTSLATNIAEHVAVEFDIPVGIFSYEMRAERLMLRMLAGRSRLNLKQVRKGNITEGDCERLTAWARKLSTAPLHFDDIQETSLGRFRAKARRMVQQFGIKLLVVDYLQLMSLGTGDGKASNRQEEVAKVSRGVKTLLEELGVPGLILSQLTDDGKLRESRAIGQDADGFWVIEIDKDAMTQAEAHAEKERQTKPDWAKALPVKLEIRKQRNEEAPISVPLTFMKQYTRFEARSWIDERDIPPQIGL